MKIYPQEGPVDDKSNQRLRFIVWGCVVALLLTTLQLVALTTAQP